MSARFGTVQCPEEEWSEQLGFGMRTTQETMVKLFGEECGASSQPTFGFDETEKEHSRDLEQHPRLSCAVGYGRRKRRNGMADPVAQRAEGAASRGIDIERGGAGHGSAEARCAGDRAGEAQDRE